MQLVGAKVVNNTGGLHGGGIALLLATAKMADDFRKVLIWVHLGGRIEILVSLTCQETLDESVLG